MRGREAEMLVEHFGRCKRMEEVAVLHTELRGSHAALMHVTSLKNLAMYFGEVVDFSATSVAVERAVRKTDNGIRGEV